MGRPPAGKNRLSFIGETWGLENPPETVAVPRLMNPAHPNAVGSYGPDVAKWAESLYLHGKKTTGSRWWQRLVLNRAMEYDPTGALCWSTVIVSAPRQTGKSWLERMVCAWRIHQTELFGEEQNVLHVAHKLLAAQEVWRPAARALSSVAKVRWANGEQQIELDDGSRWMIQAANDGSGVAFSLSMALIDEAWRVPRQVLDDALEPTMAESASPQAWIVSTAGTSDSDLMMSNRTAALAGMNADNPRALICEWSAPPDPDLPIDSPATWRACSPHWDERRLERMTTAYEKTTGNERSFRQQWLNQWVPSATRSLIGYERWPSLATVDGPIGAISFGVDLAADRTAACIVAYGDGVAEIVAVSRDPNRTEPVPGEGVGWVGDWFAARVDSHGGEWTVGIDGSGPAASVAADVLAFLDPSRVVILNGREMASASGQMFDRIMSEPARVAFTDHPLMESAVCNARWRRYGQTRTFARDDISGPSGVALVAATAAMWTNEHTVVTDEPAVY